MHLDLIISRESVHETEYFVARRGIYDVEDVRHKVQIFWSCLVQVGVIYAYPVLSILFLDNHHVGEPNGVLNFFDGPNGEKFVDLLVDSPVLFWRKLCHHC